MRVHDLLGLHGREFLGYELQCGHLDMPRLWSDPRLLKAFRHACTARCILWLEAVGPTTFCRTLASRTLIQPPN